MIGGVTAIYASLLALLWMALAFRVIGYRRSARVVLGDGGHPDLGRAIRGHGNAAESIPVLILLLLLCELTGVAGWLVHILGLLGLAGRGLHAAHFWAPGQSFLFRMAGMGLTMTAMGLSALILLVQALTGAF